MNKECNRATIESILNNTRDQLLNQLEMIPGDWTKYDIRQFISQFVNEVEC